MPIEPIKNLPINSSNSVGRAQNFSSVNLGRDSIKNAKISIGQVSSNNRPTTSVSHPNGVGSSTLSSIEHINSSNQRPLTSINQLDKKQDLSDNNDNNEISDEKRYNYIQRLIRSRKEKQTQEPSVYDLNFKTGGGFRTSGFRSIRRQLSRLYKQAPATYKNLSVADRKYFADLVKEHAKKVRVGVGLGLAVRKKIGRQLESGRRSGIISKHDKKDFKKIIDEMKP